MIKNEFRNATRCSRKVFEDVEIAKRIYDHIFLSQEEDIIIKGLIQEIRLFKFGFLLYCEKQVIFYKA
jgi:hypothetical protein